MVNTLKISLVSPKIQPGDITSNINEHISYISSNNSDIYVFPELSVSGYHCGDLFFNKNYLDECIRGLLKLNKECLKNNVLAVVGSPVYNKGSLYNCAVILGLSKILCKSKIELCVVQEYYEERWFKSGLFLNAPILVEDKSFSFELTNTLFPIDLFVNGESLRLAIDICEDAWAEVSPSMLIDNPDLIINISASSDTISTRKSRRNIIKGICERKKVPYLYVSGSCAESTSLSLLNNIHYVFDSSISYEEYNSNENSLLTNIKIDFDYIRTGKRHFGKRSAATFEKIKSEIKLDYSDLKYYEFNSNLKQSDKVDLYLPHFYQKPFHSELQNNEKSLKDIFIIQASALRRRLSHTNAEFAIVGISGGIDSAYTLLIVYEACKEIQTKPLPVILPSLGSSEESQNLAQQLSEKLGLDFKKIDISEITEKTKNKCGFENSLSIENIQARLRTALLMTIANENKGIMVGTGTMSELAVGWCTYNADNMSMYNPNGGMPKTVLIDTARKIMNDYGVEKVLSQIIERPFTPELEINNNSKTTEERVGLYSIIDFCLYYSLRYSLDRKSAIEKGKILFPHIEKRQLEFSVNSFYDKFIPSQFKRTIIPDSPKLFSFDLSPRGCLRVPSDLVNPF